MINIKSSVSLPDLFRTTHMGSAGRAIGDNLYGFNASQIPRMVPVSKETYGLTFFVRPQLNLQGDNVRNVRKFYSLLSNNDTGMHRFVRTTLDPRLMNGYDTGNGAVGNMLTCPLTDNKNAFIPVMTNNINTVSGWPDITAPIMSTDPGLYKQVWQMVDGTTDHYGTYDLDVTFKNTRGDPILYMLYVWTKYASYVLDETMVPYPDFITEHEIDYNTRIYRIILDHDKSTITKIAATGVSIPTAVPTGMFFDYDSSKLYNDQVKEFTTRFTSIGFQVYDDILMYEFNKTVATFNPLMRDEYRSSYMVEVPRLLLRYFDHRVYPYIDSNSNSLKWFVDKTYYDNKTGSVKTAFPTKTGEIVV